MNTDFKQIPKGWRLSTVGRECKICNNLREPLSEEERSTMQGSYPYYGPTKAVDYLDHFRVEGTYALIGEDGDHFLKYNNQDMTQLVCGRFNVNNHAHIVKGGPDCSTEWFYTFFRQRSIAPFLTRQGAGRFKLNKAALEKIPLLVPPAAEQAIIHSSITRWDSSIDLTERLIAAKQERRSWLLQQLLTGKRRLPGFEGSQELRKTPFGSLPTEWAYSRIGAVAKEASERNGEVAGRPVLSCTKHKGLVDSLAYFGKQIFSEDLSNYKIVRKNQFAYATNHIDEGSIGYQDAYEEALISPIYTVFQTDETIDDRFLFLVLKTETYRHIFASNTSASVDRRGSLRWSDFAKIHIPRPSIKEQQAIVKVIDTADRELDLLRNKLDALREQKKGLMQQLLTGKLRITV